MSTNELSIRTKLFFRIMYSSLMVIHWYLCNNNYDVALICQLICVLVIQDDVQDGHQHVVRFMKL